MKNLTDELKAKLCSAKSEEEAAALLKDAGGDTPLAERLWTELKHKREADGKELSLDELESVSGGRDWVTEGCAATVEPGSWCDTNDSCLIWSVTYENVPTSFPCPHCGKLIEKGDVADGIPCVFCQGKYVYNYIKKCLDPV